MSNVAHRLIALNGAVNFRDLGGYAAADGLRTRWRVLFRADGLGELTQEDLEVLRDLGIKTVIDLRSELEVARSRFDVDAHPVDFHHLPFMEELPSAERFEGGPGFLTSQYLGMVRGAGAQIVAALEVLASPEALPAVFHCTAGKDRTGVLSAIVLSLLGVDEPTVVEDYALSAQAMDRLRAKLLRTLPEAMGAVIEVDAVFSAAPEQMEHLLDHLRSEYGSVQGYVRELGADPDTLRRLRASLLEPIASPGAPGI